MKKAALMMAAEAAWACHPVVHRAVLREEIRRAAEEMHQAGIHREARMFPVGIFLEAVCFSAVRIWKSG